MSAGNVKLCAASLSLCACIALGQTGTGVERVTVGAVNGVPVDLAAISASENVFRLGFFLKTGREPSTPEEVEMIRGQLRAYQCNSIRGRVISAAEERERQRLGISVTRQEGIQDYQQRLRRGNVEKAAAAARAQANAVITALDEVAAGKDPREVYSRIVAPTGLELRHWEWIVLQAARDPTSRENIKKFAVIPGAIPADAAPGGWERNVALERVRKAVAEELAAQDPEFARFYRKREAGGSISEAQVRYVERKQIEWWQQRYREVNLVIYDEELARACSASIQSLLGLPVAEKTK